MIEQAPSPIRPPAGVRRLQAAQLRLAATALGIMMVGTVLDVFFRYVFNKPLRISYDLVESMLVIYVFHGISSVFLARRNIVIDVINSLVSPRILRGLAAIADIVSVMCLLLFLWGMWSRRRRPTSTAIESSNLACRSMCCGVSRWRGCSARSSAPLPPSPPLPGASCGARSESRSHRRARHFSLLVLLFVRVPVWAALTLVGFAGNCILSGLHSALSLAGTSAFDASSAYTLSVIPLFVLLGEVASNTRLSADLFNAAGLLLSGVRGGLAIATIAASSCFGAVCGSSIVTAATMTRIALPEMRKAGYDDRLATGALAAGRIPIARRPAGASFRLGIVGRTESTLSCRWVVEFLRVTCKVLLRATSSSSQPPQASGRLHSLVLHRHEYRCSC